MKIIIPIITLLLPSVALANGGYSQETTHTEPRERCSSYYNRPCVNKIEVTNVMPEQTFSFTPTAPECKPGRTVGAALGLAASVAVMGIGVALTARGFGESTTEPKANKGWGVGLMIAGTGGLITSAMAVKRNRVVRETNKCAPGVFRTDRPDRSKKE